MFLILFPAVTMGIDVGSRSLILIFVEMISLTITLIIWWIFEDELLLIFEDELPKNLDWSTIWPASTRGFNFGVNRVFLGSNTILGFLISK